MNEGEGVEHNIPPELIEILCREALGAAKKLRETSASGEVKQFTTTAHAMKSALASIGESELSAQAAALEKAGIDSDTGFITANSGGFAQALEDLVKKMQGAAPQPAAGGSATRHLAVVNPHSFRTRDGLSRIMSELDACFQSSPAEECKIYVSRYQRDAVAAVGRYMLSVPSGETVRVYAVGGDGILFDCLNGIIGFKNAELTSVPYGRANDFVRAFGEGAAESFRDIKKLKSAPARAVDIINYGANYALNEANIGIIGLSVTYSNAILRKPSYNNGRYITSQVYTLGGLRALMNKEVIMQEYTILIDGDDISGQYANIHVANGACNGAYLVPSPYAVPDDGLLDVILAHSAGSLNLARTIRDYTHGKFEKHKEIYSRTRCRELEVHSEQSLCVELDGESFFARDIKIKLMPGAIRFFAPESLGIADYSYRAASGRKGGAGK